MPEVSRKLHYKNSLIDLFSQKPLNKGFQRIRAKAVLANIGAIATIPNKTKVARTWHEGVNVLLSAPSKVARNIKFNDHRKDHNEHS